VIPPPAAKITSAQSKELRDLLTTNNIDPAAFKEQFKISSSLDLLASEMDAAVEWIKAEAARAKLHQLGD